jgi:hypothetical protein
MGPRMQEAVTNRLLNWTTRAGDAVLEFLLNEGNEPLVANPTGVEANLDYKISHVRRRLRALQEGSPVEYYDNDRGLYQITERGQAYPKGKLNSKALENVLQTTPQKIRR